MTEKTTHRMPLKRRRLGKTDYRKRLALLKSGKHRLVVRVKPRQIIAQIIEYNPEGDRVVISATSLELKKMGWKHHGGNVCAAYLTGLLCGKRAKEKGITEAVLDIGLHTPVHGSNVFATLKGAIDAGMTIPHSEDCFPSDERITGKTIEEYRKNNISKDVEEMKKKIMGGR